VLDAGKRVLPTFAESLSVTDIKVETVDDQGVIADRKRILAPRRKAFGFA
jgi:hypothetical protein